jgi:hypothetical protein
VPRHWIGLLMLFGRNRPCLYTEARLFLSQSRAVLGVFSHHPKTGRHPLLRTSGRGYGLVEGLVWPVQIQHYEGIVSDLRSLMSDSASHSEAVIRAYTNWSTVFFLARSLSGRSRAVQHAELVTCLMCLLDSGRWLGRTQSGPRASNVVGTISLIPS